MQGSFSSPQRHSVATSIAFAPANVWFQDPWLRSMLGLERLVSWGRMSPMAIPNPPRFIKSLYPSTTPRWKISVSFWWCKIPWINWGIIFGKFPQFIFTRNEGPRVLRHGDTVILQSDSVDELLSLLPFYFPTITSTTPPWKINPSRPKYHLKETSITKFNIEKKA